MPMTMDEGLDLNIGDVVKADKSGREFAVTSVGPGPGPAHRPNFRVALLEEGGEDGSGVSYMDQTMIGSLSVASKAPRADEAPAKAPAKAKKGKKADKAPTAEPTPSEPVQVVDPPEPPAGITEVPAPNPPESLGAALTPEEAQATVDGKPTEGLPGVNTTDAQTFGAGGPTGS